MKEQTIKYETAKLAKEKGFPQGGIYGMYNVNNESYYNVKAKNFDIQITAPTQSLLQKWLREEKSIDVVLQPERYKDGTNYIVQAQKFDFNSNPKDNPNFMVKGSYWFNDNNEYPTYEQALEKGLQEALKLIE